jgi:hypothetical protein
MVLTFDVDHAITAQFEVYINGDQMEQIMCALEAHPEEAKRIAREIVFRQPAELEGSDRVAEVTI